MTPTVTYEELMRPERHTARFSNGYPKGVRFIVIHSDVVPGVHAFEVETVMGIRCFLAARDGAERYMSGGRMFGSIEELREAI